MVWQWRHELLTCALGRNVGAQDRFAVISVKFEKLRPNLKAKVEPLIEVLEREINRLGLE